MKEREKELLSALMDGEASEHELRQALKATAEDPALAATWQRYHLAQSLLRGDRDAYAGVDLRGALTARLEAEAAPASGLRSRLQPLLKPLASMAVAASVAMFSVFSWQAWNTAPAPLAEAGALAAASGPAEQHVALGPLVMVREDGEELMMPAADGVSPTAGQDRLNTYLARHAQAASAASARGLAPYARVVSLDSEQAP